MSDERLTIQCPACHRPMVERANSQNGSRFLGCTSYPQCLTTEKIPAWLEMRRAGGIELPGMETSTGRDQE